MLETNNQPQINPHMKLAKTTRGVIQPPQNIYSYSLHDELVLGENQYRQILHSINKKQCAALAEKYPNLKSNILTVLKFTAAIGLAGIAFRYRQSIPLLKSICKKPKTSPPSFMSDIKKLWKTIVKK